MIYGDNPVKWNERDAERNDPLGLNAYTYVPDITAIMQSGNLYVYGIGNPLMYKDENGKFAIAALVALGLSATAIKMIIAGVISIAATAIVMDTIDKINEIVEVLQAKQRLEDNERRGTSARDIIAKEKKGSINSRFPKEWLDTSYGDIEKAAKRGDKSAQTAKKLLDDKDFNKDSNSTRSKK